MKWLMTITMACALTALSCDRAKPRASVLKSESGELTAIAEGVPLDIRQDPVVLEETRRYFEKLAERFSNDLPKA